MKMGEIIGICNILTLDLVSTSVYQILTPLTFLFMRKFIENLILVNWKPNEEILEL